MAFNKVGEPISLAPGGSTLVWIWWPGGGQGQQMGDDQGAIWIMADPVDLNEGVPANFPASLSVSGFTKIRDLWSSYDPETNEPTTIDATKTVVQYAVTVTNTGSEAVFFTVQGGGNT
jgi:hypothetical protein